MSYVLRYFKFNNSMVLYYKKLRIQKTLDTDDKVYKTDTNRPIFSLFRVSYVLGKICFTGPPPLSYCNIKKGPLPTYIIKCHILTKGPLPPLADGVIYVQPPNPLCNIDQPCRLLPGGAPVEKLEHNVNQMLNLCIFL